MINIQYAEKYCCEDISLIENYDRAISSDEPFDCHHRNEITLGESVNGLIKMGLYWNRPANELIFLTRSEHMTLHNTNVREETRKKMSEAHRGKQQSEEARKKMSDTRKGKTVPEETRKKMSDTRKGKTVPEETRKKMSDTKKGENNPAYGRKWMNNGIQQIYIKPDEINLYLDKGYSFGMIKNKKTRW